MQMFVLMRHQCCGSGGGHGSVDRFPMSPASPRSSPDPSPDEVADVAWDDVG